MANNLTLRNHIEDVRYVIYGRILNVLEGKTIDCVWEHTSPDIGRQADTGFARVLKVEPTYDRRG